MSVQIIGCVSGYNSEDKRCNDHVDFAIPGRSILAGEDFSCTYCGDEWKDGLTEDERRTRKMAAKGLRHCDSCLDYMPMFKGAKCMDCIMESAPKVEMDHDDTMDVTIVSDDSEEVSWSLLPIRENGVAGMRMKSEYFEGIHVTVEYFGPKNWNYRITEDGAPYFSCSAPRYEDGRTLMYVLNSAMANAFACDDERADDGDYDYPYDDSYDYDSYDYGPDTDLMNEW